MSHPDSLLQVLADSAEIGLMLIDGDRRIFLWNAWMAKASKIAAGDACGRRLEELFPQLAKGRISHAVEAACLDGMSSMLSSSLNRTLFPLFHTTQAADRVEPMYQIVVVKPLDLAGRRMCCVQVFDVTNMERREALLRQQARTMEALAENYRLSELHNRAIVDNTADAIVTICDDGAIASVNPAAERMFGASAMDLVGQSLGRFILDAVGLNGADALGAVSGQWREAEGLRSNGEKILLEFSVSGMDLGGTRLYVVICHDITSRKQAEADLRTQKEWLATLVNTMPDLICLKDADSRWLVANRPFLEVAGLAHVDYRGRSTEELLGLASAEAAGHLERICENDHKSMHAGGSHTSEMELRFSSQSSRIFDVIKIPLRGGGGGPQGLVTVGRDITERKQAAARIHHLAHHDSLTGLPNRILFHDRLRLALAQSARTEKRLALMFLDLDKFKDVNDTLGHHIGDALLKAVARRLTDCVRESDTVARLGGDEFAVILTNLGQPEDAGGVAENIIAAIAEPLLLEDLEVQTSTSIGLTLYPDDAISAEQLLKNADLAMFRSKGEGRNNYHFYVAAMDAEVQARKVMEHDLRNALGAEQMDLHYQPLVDLNSGKITGCEALARWCHPRRGWVPPAEFIPIAERSDMIFTLGRWILYRACVQGSEWIRRGLPPLQIAVNLSPVQFRQQQSLDDMVAEIIDRTGFPARLLQLEITEGIAMQNVENTIDVLQRLRRLGVSISIDDFGTGYSSLNYLRRFPVDKLKIDRSFIGDLDQQPDSAAMVKAIVELGHSLRTRVNVEGVETRSQLDFLKAQAVDEVQGYYFSGPLPADDFIAFVQDSLC